MFGEKQSQTKIEVNRYNASVPKGALQLEQYILFYLCEAVVKFAAVSRSLEKDQATEAIYAHYINRRSHGSHQHVIRPFVQKIMQKAAIHMLHSVLNARVSLMMHIMIMSCSSKTR